jgi:hypothetical protein
MDIRSRVHTLQMKRVSHQTDIKMSVIFARATRQASRLCGRVLRVLNGPVMEDHELIGAQRQRRVRSPLVIAELDFEDGRRQLLDDGANLTARQAAIWKILEERNDVE